MKSIYNYLNEQMAGNVRVRTKEELQKIIINRIQSDGPDCDLNNIDVSHITDMSYLFNARENDIFKKFNGDISKWNVSKVKDMNRMFLDCENFNQDLSNWDVANVTDMNAMFAGCKKFNGDISSWDVACVKDIGYMFWRCRSFAQNIDNWDVRNVKYMSYAFEECRTQPNWYKKEK